MSLQARANANLAVLEKFVEENPSRFGFLAQDDSTRSNTSVCLTVNMDGDKLKEMIAWYVCICCAIVAPVVPLYRSRTFQHIRLSAENVAHDIGAYRDAPDGKY